MHSLEEKKEQFARLLNIMSDLRKQCPWDKEQTFESLRTLTIEETYELAEAILNDNKVEVSKELGDLLLHIVFYAEMGSETGDFDIVDVIDKLCTKLIYRHPHIYGDVDANNAEKVKQNWEDLKLKEQGGNKSVLAGVPPSLPALVKAHRIQDKARSAGFDWDVKEQVWDKVKEEIGELQDEIAVMDKDKMEAEFGDLLFSIINAARLYDINPENALERTNRKFIKRFNYLESQTIAKGLDLKKMSLEEMEAIWQETKKE
ncbi:MAG: nucleoside triphosphate pyrophosphohydrolase [Bacteroidales bacterium 36-12]|nr:MAG: nucleoside triphosphate pyrophosphohydrolase [Bacteroidales bacterium 36-12]